VGLAVSGCAAPASTVSVSGTKLTIYASAPSGLAGDSRAQDVLAAERLAFQQGSKTVGKFTLQFVVLHGAKPSDNARTAIKDSSTIAYLGEIVPGQSAQSLGILNAADVLTVSPTDTAVELTQSTPAVPGAPGIYYESLSTYGRTFARLVPTTALEARALVAQAQQLGASKIYVTGDGQPYGAALTSALSHAAGSNVIAGPPGIDHFRSSGAGAFLYAGANARDAAAQFNAIAAADPSAKLLAPSALDYQQFVSLLSPAAQGALYVSAPGSLPSQLPSSFTSAFQSATGHGPSPEAYFGYEATQLVLAAVHEAGTKAGDRATVVRNFIPTTTRSEPLGIDPNGDTHLASFVISRVRAGALIPYRSINAHG
jgi:ABC-type branched-subunit amino acid transport system substrate-binding protein